MRLDDALGLVDAGHDRDDHEGDREDDRELEEGLLNPAPRPVDRVATAAEGAAEALPRNWSRSATISVTARMAWTMNRIFSTVASSSAPQCGERITLATSAGE